MTSLDGLNPDFRDMVAMLCDERAEFLVVGAYAVSFHGHPRTTGDMDLLVRPTAANAARVWHALVRSRVWKWIGMAGVWPSSASTN